MLRGVSLSAKLMLALVLTVLAAVGSVMIVVDLSAKQHFESYLSVGARPWLAGLVPVLVEHYAETGSWDGVEGVLQDARSGPSSSPGRGFQGGGGMSLMLADAEGRVISDAAGQFAGERLGEGALGQGQPIEVAGRTVGYLLVGNGPRERQFSEGLVTSILWAGVLASFVAIVLGLLLTRAVVKPVRIVRDATQRVAAGDLSHRVPVTSGDEIGDLARQFNDMASSLERDEQLRRKMMADISHELRTPLAVMRGQVEAVQDGIFEPSPENIAPIHDQVLLLGRLVDDLRDLALAEAGRLRLERAEVQLGRLVGRVVNAFRSRAQGRGVSLLAEIPDPLPLVDADAQRLEQVVGNLLDNALRYTEPGGSIRVRAWSDPAWVSFAVVDDGAGIPPEDLPHVFDRFYGANGARSRAEGGSGLGLSIAKQLAEAHGGHISAESELGTGSTFTVRLPRLPS